MTTAKEDAYARRYYKTHSKYRKKKIEERKEYAKSHKKEEAEQSRDYYHSTPTYRKRRIAQVSAYNRAHKTKKRK
jgi:hypothetical protein